MLEFTPPHLVEDAQAFVAKRRAQNAALASACEFSLSPNQESVRTYHTASPAVFDITKETPGTLFRVSSQVQNELGGLYTRWAWYIIGQLNDGPIVYHIHHTNEKEAVLSQRPNLVIGKSVRLVSLHIDQTEQYFAIAKANLVLRKGELPEKAGIPQSLDVMHIGKDTTGRKEKQITPKLTKLIPLYQEGI